MIWQDLLLDQWADDSTLRAATASAFEIPVGSVAMADTPEQLIEVPPAACIILERIRQQRDFPLQLLIVVRDAALAERFAGFDGALRVARKLADHLLATVLFAEGPASPSEWVRVRPSGQLDIVSLDTDETGEVESFFVVAERALPVDRRAGDPTAPRLTL